MQHHRYRTELGKGEKFIAKQVDKRKKKKLEKDEHKMVGWGAYRKRAFNCKSKFVTEREEAGRCNFSVKPLKNAFVFQQDGPSCEETHRPQGDFTSWQYAKQRLSLWDTQVCRYAAIMLSESRIKVAAEARAAATAAMPCSKLASSSLQQASTQQASSSLHENNDDYTKMPALISLVPP
ncbi:hypothetical protein Tco_0756729 [Tanacetum coccineum]